MSELPTIGFVGVGRMGAGMARRLHDLGFRVTAVSDTNVAAAKTLADEIGAEATTSLARVTEAAEVVVTVVSDDAAMRRIFATSGDSLLTGARGRTFLNCATLSPEVQREIEALATAAGAHAIEACMASSIPQARNGTLYLMIGGDRAVFDAQRPLLDALGSTVTYVGGAGRAAQLKALVNMVMNINTAGLAEGLGLADALGLDLDLVRSVFAQTGANSRVLETDGADMQHRDHDVFFSAAHAAKDSGIALALADEAGLTLPLAKATHAQYEEMKRLGLGELDKSGVSELTFRERHAPTAG